MNYMRSLMLGAFLFVGLMLTNIIGLSAQSSFDEKARAYIEQHAAMAVREQQRTGIPAAIKLAQGVYETGAGESRLCTLANNHFGIKCKSTWTGPTIKHTDDAKDECFRSYSCTEDSYKDHSDFLRNNKRYENLFKLDMTDYAGWAHGLKAAGYATNPKYAQRIIKVIEDYNLQQYTLLALNQASDKPSTLYASTTKAPVATTTEASAISTRVEVDNPQTWKKPSPKIIYKNGDYKYGEVYTVNGLKAIYCQKGTALLDVAVKYNLRYARLLQYNDLEDAPLPFDMLVYLERKSIKADKPSHIVREGETLLSIAQAYGIQLKSLRSYNNLGVDEEPLKGVTLNLQVPSAVKVAAQKVEPTTTQQDYALLNHTANLAEDVVTFNNTTHYESEGPAAHPTSRLLREKEMVKIPKAEDTLKKLNELPVDEPVAEELFEDKNLTETVPPTTASDTIKVVEAELVPNDIEVAKPVVQETLATPAEPQVIKQRLPTKRRNTTTREPVEGLNIANLTAIDEGEEVKNPRYIAPKKDEDNVEKIRTRPRTINPDEEPVRNNNTSTKVTPSQNTAPKSSLDALKEKLDKVVYANEHVAASSSQTTVTSNHTEAAPTTTVNNGTAATAKYHTVQKGETAFQIAKKYGISVKQLNEWNGIDFSSIKVGQKLRVQ